MNLTQYYLIKLSEEAAEVSQRALKAAQFGLEESQEGQPYTNAQRLSQEINDFEVIVGLLNDLGLGHEADIPHRLNKLTKLSKYFNYSKELGLVKDAE